MYQIPSQHQHFHQYQQQYIHEGSQLRSVSSMSTMNSEMDSSNFNQSGSSAHTSTNSSPYNHKIQQQQQQYNHLQQPSISEADEHSSGQSSPDLMGTEFYSSDNITHDHNQHAQNLRKSMIYSESFDSTKFQSVRDSIFIDNDNNIATLPLNTQEQEVTKLAMTNSPSFSALASILEKKTHQQQSSRKPTSNLQTSTIAEDMPSDYETTPKQTNYDLTKSPNLIQLDDQDQTPNLNIPRESSYSSIMDSPNTGDLVSPQFYQKIETSENYDIFKTPEVPQLHTFHNSSSLSQISSKKDNEESSGNSPEKIKINENFVSMIDDHSEVPEIINTPQIYKTSSFEGQNSSFTPKQQSQPQHQHIQTPPPVSLPKNRLNQLFTSPQYKQRSSSLPVLTKKNDDIKPIEQVQQPTKKKNKFMAFFKSNKRSVSSSQVETKQSTKLQPKSSPLSSKPQPLQQSQQKSLPRSQQSTPNIPSSMSSHRLPKKSTSSTSLFDAFKRKNKQQQQQQQQTSNRTPISKSSNDIPNITVNSNFKQIDNDEVNDNDDSFSVSTVDSNEFNEDFNKLNVSKQRPTSQISQTGGDVFPKSLNPQEVESIVSLERNRSVRSRHSTMSQQRPFSLTDAINSNAKEEGMYVTYAMDKEPSIPDLTKSPTTSVLKKESSMSSFNKIDDDYVNENNNRNNDEHDNNDDDFQYDFGEDFSTALEFDDIADNYNAEEHQAQILAHETTSQNEGEDVSNFMEFADFIDFGDELQLNFDLDDQSSRSSPNMKTLRPPSVANSIGGSSTNSSNFQYNNKPSPRLQPPLSTRPFNSPPQPAPESPLLESPILQSEPFRNLSSSTSYDRVSPALQPLPTFIQEQASRPMSMSFKGLKAPALSNHHYNRPVLSSSSSFVSQISSSKASSIKNPNRRVVFSSKIVLYDAWNEDDYDRHPDVATCNQLTPQIAQRIKEELNELKSEMEVHEESQCYTHFY
ncbi:RHO GTPase-activating protein [Wickerhamomyces ciferrii]|uniref:RHO GTPase-activating protein n=1 Tax=Wickerhamomyces ciferrii (strain ATCC 14091 / BCRC 22168 / CBS 111 / JCM 3599 / NBRC 0793 / NRRL Y-1031 F-60-10) TaxID=1206466 RepID=K0KR19_WICCF|nr:RHO GTPase-activating protein [Wickerhamomyces ciferrii]CCH44552.1 RHO GTPase-activating protein [Wickerhamomyces ciferrii]